VKEFTADPQHSFPGHGQMKPEAAEITALKREGAKLKAERDILKKPQPTLRRRICDVRFLAKQRGISPIGCAGRSGSRVTASVRG
jgi:transposase-like protein